MIAQIITSLKNPTRPEMSRLRHRYIEAVLQENQAHLAACMAARNSLEEGLGLATAQELPSSSFLSSRATEEERTHSTFRKFFTRG